MYIPSFYKNTNTEEVRRFIQENGFGTLILQNSQGVPDIEDDPEPEDAHHPWRPIKDAPVRKSMARHLPFIMDLDSDHYIDGKSFQTLTAHMGTHYPIYNCFESKREELPGEPGFEGDEALVIFEGPNCYMSPTWYDNVEGATWNYISVHVYGRIERLGDRDLEKLIKALLYKYEKHYKTDPRLTLDMMPDRFEYLKRYIGAVRIHVENVEVNVQAAYKLSQDQTDWSRQNAIKHLRETGLIHAQAVADEMEKRNFNVQRGMV